MVPPVGRSLGMDATRRRASAVLAVLVAPLLVTGYSAAGSGTTTRRDVAPHIFETSSEAHRFVE